MSINERKPGEDMVAYEERLVRDIGTRIGFGRTIQLCERLWGELLPGGVSPAAHASARLAAYDAREPLLQELLHVLVMEDGSLAARVRDFKLAERQAAPANLESVAQPDTPDAHVGEPSAAVNAALAEVNADGSPRDVGSRSHVLAAEVERLRKLIAEGDFKELYAEGLMVGQRLGRAEHNSELARLRLQVTLNPILGEEGASGESGV